MSKSAVNQMTACTALELASKAVRFQPVSRKVRQELTKSMERVAVAPIIFESRCRTVPNVMKISVKINTMQNINILLFVRSLFLIKTN